jgi:hypothetical protein
MTVRIKADIVCDGCGFKLEYGDYYIILAPTGTEVREWAAAEFGWQYWENRRDLCSDCQEGSNASVS